VKVANEEIHKTAERPPTADTKTQFLPKMLALSAIVVLASVWSKFYLDNQSSRIENSPVSDNSQSSPSEPVSDDSIEGGGTDSVETVSPAANDILGRLNDDSDNAVAQVDWWVDSYSGDLPAEIVAVYLSDEGDGSSGCSVWVIKDNRTTERLVNEGFFDWHNEYWQWGTPAGSTWGVYMIYTDPSLDCYIDAAREFRWPID
jgi:hypothetical protein